jgi:hypothetical protein
MEAPNLSNEPDWKLKLRYGRATTPFRHFTVVANGRVEAANPFKAVLGPAFMGMKVWASSEGEAADMIQVIGRDLNFECKGRIEVFVTEAEQPPRDKPFGYDIRFTSYQEPSS